MLARATTAIRRVLPRSSWRGKDEVFIGVAGWIYWRRMTNLADWTLSELVRTPTSASIRREHTHCTSINLTCPGAVVGMG